MEERALFASAVFSNFSDLVITDRPSGGAVIPVTSIINVPTAGTIQDIDVQLNITHSFVADLDVFLIGPDNTRIHLFTDIGGSGDNFVNTILDDEATAAINTASAPFTGRFRPEVLSGTPSTLAAFDGKAMQGNWKLELTDDANLDAGFLDSWSLTIEYTPPAAANTPPVNTLPGPLAVYENSSTIISGLAVADDGIGGSSVTVNLNVLHGTLSINTAAAGGVGAGSISGNNSASVTLTGTPAQLNATFTSSIAYRPSNGYVGADTMSMQATDAGGLSDIDALAITVLAVIGGETLVNTETDDDQVTTNKQSVAMDGAGNSVVVWTSTGQDRSGSLGVFAQLFDAAGNRRGEEFQVNTFTLNSQSLPSVAMHANGAFVIVWRSFGQEPGPESNGVFARLYNAAGEPRGAEFQVNSTTIDEQTQPSVAVDALGNFVVVWQSFGQDGNDLGIFARRFDADGIALTGELSVNTITLGAQSNPVVSSDAAGNFVVVWQGPDAGNLGIFARRFQASGVAIDAAEFAVNQVTAGFQQLPSVAMDADGDFVVAWQTFGQDGGGDAVYARRYTAAGVPQNEFRVNSHTPSNQRRATVDADGAGNFLITWSSFSQDSGTSSGIYGQRFDAAGNRLGNEFRISTTLVGDQINSSVALADNGAGFLVVWSGNGVDDDAGVFAQWYGADEVSGAFAGAQLLRILDDDSVSQKGLIDTAGDQDAYRYVATVSGLVSVDLQRTSGSTLDTYLFAHDGEENLLDEDDDGGTGTDSFLSIAVTAGQTYYFRAAAFGSSVGAYELVIIPMPDLAGTAFEVGEPGAQWGATVTVKFTIRNLGSADAAASVVVPVLSADGIVDTTNGAGNVLLTLDAIGIPSLGAGASITNTLQIKLPDAAPAGFADAGEIFLGFIVDYNNDVIELNGNNNRNRGIGLDLDALTIIDSAEVESNNATANAVSMVPTNADIAGRIVLGDVDYYRFDLSNAGFLDASVIGEGGLDSRLSLYSVDSLLTLDGMPIGGGGLLMSSDDLAPGNLNPRIRQYLLPGRYYLAVSSAAFGTAAVGDYHLTTQFTAAANNPVASDATASLIVGSDPRAIITGDFNRDGILDLATANRDSGDVSILRGLGDGNFEPERRFDVPNRPTELIAFDFNNDGRLDLGVIDRQANAVTLLPGVGDGTFLPHSRQDLALNDPAVPDAIRETVNRVTAIPDSGMLSSRLKISESTVIADLDVIVNIRHSADADLTVYLIGPDGSRVQLFSDVTLPITVFPNGDSVEHDFSNVILDDEAPTDAHESAIERTRFRPSQLLSGFDGKNTEGWWTLEIHDVSANGSTGELVSWSLVVNDRSVHTNFSLASADFDFNRDGNLDRAGLFFNRVVIDLFVPVARTAIADLEKAGLILLVEDFVSHGDLRPQQLNVEALVQGSLFVPSDRVASDRILATPLFGDLNGDQITDVVLVRDNGDIVVRHGVAGSPGMFDAPFIINAGAPDARAVVVVREGAAAMLATIDLFSNTLSLYRRAADGSWQHSPGPAAGLLPLRLAVGDLDGDGRNDLVVANAELASLSFFLAQADDSFIAQPQLKVGRNLADLQLADVNQDTRLDVLFTDPNSGTVAVLLNRGLPTGELGFEDERRFRAGADGYGVVEGISAIANDALENVYGLAGAFPAQFFTASLHATGAVVEGDFNGDGIPDLVVSNRNSNTFSLLLGKAENGQVLGSYVDPIVFDTWAEPTAVRAGHLNDDDFLDLIVLNEGSGTIAVCLGDGQGGFAHQVLQGPGIVMGLAAGNSPTGMSVTDIDGDGDLDILIGNTFGDLLVLTGRGNGEFDPYQRSGQHVAIAVMDVDGDGTDDNIIFGNAALDRVSISYGGSPNEILQARDNGILAPGAVRLADLNRDGNQDLLVANGGGTNLFVYLGSGAGQFGGRQEFFVGANPAGVTIADVNNDQIADVVVANRGSNDVSVLLGQGQGTTWTMTPGLRLDTGAGPVATVVRDVNDDGIADLLVSNQQAGTVTQLLGQGGGFFNDQNAVTFPVGSLPGDLFVGNFDGLPGLDLATVNAASNSVTMIANFFSSPSIFTSSSGGIRPVAGLSSDFNGDSIADLVVANNVNGVISLLLGGPNGFTLDSFAEIDRHPTALALADGPGAFYVGLEGEEVARLTFSLGFDGSDGDAAGGADRIQFTLLTPLASGGLAVVVGLQTGGDELSSPALASNVLTEELLGVLSLLMTGGRSIELSEEAPAADTAHAWPRLYDNDRPVVDFIIGLRETEERLRDEARQRLNPRDATAATLPPWLREVVAQVLSRQASMLAETTWRTSGLRGENVNELRELVRQLLDVLQQMRDAAPIDLPSGAKGANPALVPANDPDRCDEQNSAALKAAVVLLLCLKEPLCRRLPVDMGSQAKNEHHRMR